MRTERLLLDAKSAATLRHKLALMDITAQHIAGHRSHFNPNQPRVPAGNPDGGQWTSVGGAIGSRLAAADKPRLGRHSAIAIAVEIAKRVIEAYRSKQGLWDLFGHKNGTIAFTMIDGTKVFGSNSTSPAYTSADKSAALRLRDILVEKYPGEFPAEHVGRMPNDALFHAETTVLLRAAREKGRDSGRSDFDGARRRPPLQQLRSCATLCRIGTGQSHCYFCPSEWFNENDARWRLAEQQVKKSVYFDVFDRRGWPSPDELQHYFLAPPGQRWTFGDGEGRSWGLTAKGVDGTEHLGLNERININLTMVGHPDHGVLLQYRKLGGGYKDIYYSKGDLTRLEDLVWIGQEGDLMPIGLFIPFDRAWLAVKGFIETDGALPKSIDWIADADIPDEVFPDPALVSRIAKAILAHYKKKQSLLAPKDLSRA